MTLPFDLGPGGLAWLGLVCFGAGFVRGYSGFGFAALVVTGGALVADPLAMVPVVVLADLLLTAQQARGIRAEVDWGRVGRLFVGCLLGVPLSVALLAQVGADAARAAISVYVLAMCGLPVAAWFAAQALPAARFRATLIAYFTALDLWSLPMMAAAGMVGRDTLAAVLILFPAMSAGVWAGGRRFLAAPPDGFRRFAILLLAALALAGLARSVV